MEYSEEDAVKYMRQAANTSYDDDDLLNIIDIIWDYYEAKGLLSLDFDADDEAELDEDDLTKHVAKMLRSDKGNNVNEEDVESLVKAELEYEKTLEQ